MEAGVDIYAQSHSAALASRGIPPLMHSFSVGSPGSSGSAAVGSTSLLLSPRGPAVYSSEDTVESVIGNQEFQFLNVCLKYIFRTAYFIFMKLQRWNAVN